MKTIQTTTVIDAPPEVVCQVITDLPRSRDWNPFITSLDGDLRVVGRLRASFSLVGRKPRTLAPTVIVFEPGRQLTWLGRLAIPKLFDGEHGLSIEPHDTGILLIPHRSLPAACSHRSWGGSSPPPTKAVVDMDTALARHAETVAAGA